MKTSNHLCIQSFHTTYCNGKIAVHLLYCVSVWPWGEARRESRYSSMVAITLVIYMWTGNKGYHFTTKTKNKDKIQSNYRKWECCRMLFPVYSRDLTPPTLENTDWIEKPKWLEVRVVLGCIGSNDLNKQRRGKARDHAQITRDRNELEKEARRRFPLIKATGIRTQFCGLEFIFTPKR